MWMFRLTQAFQKWWCFSCFSELRFLLRSRPHSVSFLGKESLSQAGSASVLGLFWANFSLVLLRIWSQMCVYSAYSEPPCGSSQQFYHSASLPQHCKAQTFTRTTKQESFHEVCVGKAGPKPRVKLEWQKVSSNLKLLGRPDQINPLIASCKGRISILRQRRSLHAWDCQHVTGNRCHLIKALPIEILS